jgi:phospholipase A1
MTGFLTAIRLLVFALTLSSTVDAHEVETGHDGKTEHTVEIENSEQTDSLVRERIERERAVQDNRSVLLAHKRNYVLPLAYTNSPNDDVFAPDSSDFGVDLDHTEVHFQISMKAPIAESLLTDEDALFFGFTVRSFWQAYNSDISSPFRETNYEPELFWITPVPWKVLGGDSAFAGLGLSHQSNGRSQLFSRSWNRVYALLGWERWRWVFAVKAWYRIPEDDKDDPLDPDGDDNPDIEDYMGNFEFEFVYRKNDYEVGMMLRNNLDSRDNRGAVQFDWTFPMHRRFRGYLQIFNGYGESLIDYDANITRVGVGILLSDLL